MDSPLEIPEALQSSQYLNSGPEQLMADFWPSEQKRITLWVLFFLGSVFFFLSFFFFQ